MIQDRLEGEYFSHDNSWLAVHYDSPYQKKKIAELEFMLSEDIKMSHRIGAISMQKQYSDVYERILEINHLFAQMERLNKEKAFPPRWYIEWVDREYFRQIQYAEKKFICLTEK